MIFHSSKPIADVVAVLRIGFLVLQFLNNGLEVGQAIDETPRLIIAPRGILADTTQLNRLFYELKANSTVEPVADLDFICG